MQGWSTQHLADCVCAAISHAWIPPRLRREEDGLMVGQVDWIQQRAQPPSLATRDKQAVELAALRRGGGAAAAAAAVRARTIQHAVDTPCMFINQLGQQPGIPDAPTQLPQGCTLHCTSKTHTHAPASDARPARPGEQRYMVVAVAANVRDTAHRWLAYLRLGPPPYTTSVTGGGDRKRCEAVHLCDNKGCVNPYHIVWVSAGATGGQGGARGGWGEGGGAVGHACMAVCTACTHQTVLYCMDLLYWSKYTCFRPRRIKERAAPPGGWPATVVRRWVGEVGARWGVGGGV